MATLAVINQSMRICRFYSLVDNCAAFVVAVSDWVGHRTAGTEATNKHTNSTNSPVEEEEVGGGVQMALGSGRGLRARYFRGMQMEKRKMGRRGTLAWCRSDYYVVVVDSMPNAGDPFYAVVFLWYFAPRGFPC